MHSTTNNNERKNDRQDKMNSAAYQSTTITIDKNFCNVTDSYKNVWNTCEILASDEKHQILEGSPIWHFREGIGLRVRAGRTKYVGDCLLRMSKFEASVRAEIGLSVLCCFIIWL